VTGVQTCALPIFHNSHPRLFSFNLNHIPLPLLVACRLSLVPCLSSRRYWCQQERQPLGRSLSSLNQAFSYSHTQQLAITHHPLRSTNRHQAITTSRLFSYHLRNLFYHLRISLHIGHH